MAGVTQQTFLFEIFIKPKEGWGTNQSDKSGGRRGMTQESCSKVYDHP